MRPSRRGTLYTSIQPCSGHGFRVLRSALTLRSRSQLDRNPCGLTGRHRSNGNPARNPDGMEYVSQGLDPKATFFGTEHSVASLNR